LDAEIVRKILVASAARSEESGRRRKMTIGAAGGHARPAGGFELGAWIFMRVSGIVLLLMALIHLGIMHIINNVDVIDYAFVARRYAVPFWRMYDWVMLTLALLHGFNGARMLVDDYFRPGGRRTTTLAVLYLIAFVTYILGSYTILTFIPKV
jgi:succinate dehydrogenase / fumarate reductase membrane anchor subunit